MNYSIKEGTPSVKDYLRILSALGWPHRDPRAIKIAMANSVCSVCAEDNGKVVGFGRIVGDGALHLYITDLFVHPLYQNRGVGSEILRVLSEYCDSIEFTNTFIELIPSRGKSEFYRSFGFHSLETVDLAMGKWINPDLK